MRSKGPEGVPFVTRTVTGALFGFYSGDLLADQVKACGFWDWRVQALAAEFCPRGGCIVEVGANTGTETVGFADIVGPRGRVFAFEPGPNIYEALAENVRINGFANVRLYNSAAADRTGSMRFVCPPLARNSGEGYVTSLGTADQTSIDVEVVTLDSLAEELGSADMMTIDVEGYEIGVLRGARSYLKKCRPILVVEAIETQLNRAGADLRGLLAELSSVGYKVFEINRLFVRSFDPNVATADYSKNWLCLPSERATDSRRANQIIRRCGTTPGIGRLNPLRRLRRTAS